MYVCVCLCMYMIEKNKTNKKKTNGGEKILWLRSKVLQSQGLQGRFLENERSKVGQHTKGIINKHFCPILSGEHEKMIVILFRRNHSTERIPS